MSYHSIFQGANTENIRFHFT